MIERNKPFIPIVIFSSAGVLAVTGVAFSVFGPVSLFAGGFLAQIPAALAWTSGVGGVFLLSADFIFVLIYGVASTCKKSKKTSQIESSGDFFKGEEGPLAAKNSALRKVICSTPPYKEEIQKEGALPTRDFISLFTHVHQILDNVYLGDYRAYLSVDPTFVEQYPLVDDIENIIENPNDLQRKYLEDNLDYRGCSDKEINVVISATQFKPQDNVSADDWSRFEPDLKGLGVERIQIEVDDDEFAWNQIEPHLEEIFKKIDYARLNNQNILIHCVKGASRSATIVYAYLMNRCGVTLEQAYNFVRSIRHQVELKPGLERGLKDYEARIN